MGSKHVVDCILRIYVNVWKVYWEMAALSMFELKRGKTKCKFINSLCSILAIVNNKHGVFYSVSVYNIIIYKHFLIILL